ncbi:hydratase [Clostridium grantii]|uniref:Aconitate hydratase n=1 Tax=Clostridium grantii DSM 8605 TaxID=1121316 RepID=A0A1M5WSH6_9CLOT|nr:hydratase [Clostridium grantii]SHH90556.1 aconitate hydratase [Clostridium grantii DSM 8605]
MINIINQKMLLVKNQELIEANEKINIDDLNRKFFDEGNERLNEDDFELSKAQKKTMAFNILENHNLSGNMENLKLKFDTIASHDITFVGIIQTAKACGLEKFPMEYVLTNCHNSLCAVGGTINEDDHLFGLSAAKKYGGTYVPAHQAVIHQYMREMMAGCGKMILGSDSHTRYGALGTMAMGEGGPELVKQLLKRTYDIKNPEIIAVYLENEPKAYVGPQDVALSIIKEVFKTGFVKNKVMEFVGPGISKLTVDFRNGVDVMTTETTCLSSIWCTDDKVREYLKVHGRENEYKEIMPGKVACYDGVIKVDLSKIEPVIALPFHPSNVFSIKELNANPYEILRSVEEDAKQLFKNSNLNFKLTNKIKDGKIHVDQGIIAGCAGGTYENISIAGEMLADKFIGSDEFSLMVYPSSQPVNFELNKNGTINKLLETGAIVKTAFCGPCFGAGDTPSNNALSIRHTTRNFPNREGSKPKDGQISSVALMDSRSIAATAINKGILTSAEDCPTINEVREYSFNDKIYKNRVYSGFNKVDDKSELLFGPNIKPWPEMIEITDNLLLKVACVIKDEVTTTDELIPSGETSSYRSDPFKLAEFTLSRKDPEYVNRAKSIKKIEDDRINVVENNVEVTEEIEKIFNILKTGKSVEELIKNTSLGSVIYANKPGDGSAREQAASCQKVLGGWANIAIEYATKRYRSNCINWGMVPFKTKEKNIVLKNNEYIFIPGIKVALENGENEVEAFIIGENNDTRKLTLYIDDLTKDEREIILSGCLINYYKTH